MKNLQSKYKICCFTTFRSEMLSKPYDSRYVIVDIETGEILDFSKTAEIVELGNFY